MQLSITRTNSATTLSTSDEAILMSGANYNVTLPSNPSDGTTYFFKNVDFSGVVQVIAGSGDTLEGSSGMGMGPTQANIFVFDATARNWCGLGYW